MERKLAIAAACIAAIIAIIMPAGFFAVGYQSEVTALRTEAHINARLVSSIINANPPLWEYEQHRLENLLANWPGEARARRARSATSRAWWWRKAATPCTGSCWRKTRISTTRAVVWAR